MNIEIDEKTITETILCKKNFECLKNDKKVICKVENGINEGFFITKCIDNQICSYKKSIGYSPFQCTCPTRKEILNKYGI